MSRRSFALRAVAAALTGASLAVWIVVLRPPVLGGDAGYVIVVGESMEPTMYADDLVIVRQRARYQPGDVIAYRIPEGQDGAGTMVIHRVIGGSAAEGYVTQGDNRDTVDLWRPRPADVVGKTRFRVPGVGIPLRYLRSPLGLAGVVSLTVFLFVAFWIPPSARRQPTASTA